MKMDKVKISIIVPVYNVESYLPKCLDSIISQDFYDFEIICVNDGSTDLSREILKEYKALDSRIIIIDQTNQGLSAARNTGMKVSNGKYLCFVDSDDMLDVSALRKLYSCAEENRAEIVTYETKPLIYENDSLRDDMKDKYYKVDGDYRGVKKGSELYCEMVENDDYVESAWLIFANRHFLEDKGIIFEVGRYFEDGKFSQDCYFSCSRMVHLGEQLYYYRIRENSIMTETYTVKHAVDRMWQLDEVLKEIYKGHHSDRELNALSKYATQVAMSLQFVSGKLTEEDKSSLRKYHGIYEFFRRTYELDRREKIYSGINLISTVEGLLNTISCHRAFVIYGAGIAGKRFLKFIKLFGKEEKIEGFITTDIPKETYFEGFRVRKIDEYINNPNILIVLAAGKKYEAEMYDNARRLGFWHIYLLPSELRGFIKNCDDFSQLSELQYLFDSRQKRRIDKVRK